MIKSALFLLPTLILGLFIWVFINFEWLYLILAGGFVWGSLSMLQGLLCMGDGYNSVCDVNLFNMNIDIRKDE